MRSTAILFFLSGAAALVYQVVWARSLGLVLGASHLAVATVLSVFMAGLALGNRLLAGVADRSTRPLRLYGLLECATGLSALGFLALMSVYPRLFGALAGGVADDRTSLTVLRAAFALVAMIVPTTLMGGTFPVMTRFVAADAASFPRQLARLYALNTLGAVAGTLAAGFLLLRHLGATATLLAAVALSLAVGITAIRLQRGFPRLAAPLSGAGAPAAPAATDPQTEGRTEPALARAMIAGVAASGFCALGYEVLWTRMLTFGVGTSVYSFAIMLAAFLAGMALGSQVLAMLAARGRPGSATGFARLFAATQVAIGVAAFVVTARLSVLPATVGAVQAALGGAGGGPFTGRLATAAALAFGHLAVPAFFMGAAVPAAGAALRRGAAGTGDAVGRLLAANTVGAIVGPLVAGFLLVEALGMERSLNVLAATSVATGLLAAAATVARHRGRALAIAALGAVVLVAGATRWTGTWDRDVLARFVNNTPAGTALDARGDRDLEVVFYREGINETVSVFRSLNGIQTYVVNGRAEASSAAIDIQLQRALGHLPMLLHPQPRDVFVLGTGTAMTLGATARHPGVRRLVLAEIEREMIAVGRRFARWNGDVLDDPRLQVVIDDGRNFLATTRERFDVISADPIHPWSGGAGYLYTREFFASVAARLAPGGIASQWLPLYELGVHDVRTVVRTFAATFPHVMVFATYYDAVLVGSLEPIAIDPAALQARLAAPGIAADLAVARMDGVTDILSYFVMGTAGARRFGAGGALNTDDNLVLEFSAPASQGVPRCEAANVAALETARESLAGYLAPGATGLDTARLDAIGRAFGPAHARRLAGDPEATRMLAGVEAMAPDYAPLRFVRDEERYGGGGAPEPVGQAVFQVVDAGGGGAALQVDAVRQYLSRERALVSFVQLAGRRIYGQALVDGDFTALDDAVRRRVDAGLAALTRAVGALPPARDGLPAAAAAESALREAGARSLGRVP
ncbi:MAG: fused MFS/spermidine synthase [bacterium]|nr:fused MFS/spermidine synthase [bacterium]